MNTLEIVQFSVKTRIQVGKSEIILLAFTGRISDGVWMGIASFWNLN
jgi:hypothetical protein